MFSRCAAQRAHLLLRQTQRCHRAATKPLSTIAASHPSNKIQVYLSNSSDPLLNLSVEHHLLQSTPPDSTILLLYINSPCVVFGRNQNPWIEANLSQLAKLADSDCPVQLVRRRSGGGTVFHDQGNVNFSVICPPADFDRDKHAEMVVRALNSLGRPNIRVNARHDIVMDVDKSSPDNAPGNDTFKISGSAYKLTRLRSLHHGTCLLSSPNLGSISGMLRSPAEGLIKTRGVDSVRSPVRNVKVDIEAFKDAVVAEFRKMYGDFDIMDEIDDDASLQVEKVRQGYRELQSRNWLFGQTPRFTFCTHSTAEDPRLRSGIPFQTHVLFESRQGVIEKFNIGHNEGDARPVDGLVGTTIHDVQDWTNLLRDAGVKLDNIQDVGAWMNHVLGTSFTSQVFPERVQ